MKARRIICRSLRRFVRRRRSPREGPIPAKEINLPPEAAATPLESTHDSDPPKLGTEIGNICLPLLRFSDVNKWAERLIGAPSLPPPWEGRTLIQSRFSRRKEDKAKDGAGSDIERERDKGSKAKDISFPFPSFHAATVIENNTAGFSKDIHAQCSFPSFPPDIHSAFIGSHAAIWPSISKEWDPEQTKAYEWLRRTAHFLSRNTQGSLLEVGYDYSFDRVQVKSMHLRFPWIPVDITHAFHLTQSKPGGLSSFGVDIAPRSLPWRVGMKASAFRDSVGGDFHLRIADHFTIGAEVFHSFEAEGSIAAIGGSYHNVEVDQPQESRATKHIVWDQNTSRGKSHWYSFFQRVFGRSSLPIRRASVVSLYTNAIGSLVASYATYIPNAWDLEMGSLFSMDYPTIMSDTSAGISCSPFHGPIRIHANMSTKTGWSMRAALSMFDRFLIGCTLAQKNRNSSLETAVDLEFRSPVSKVGW
eukprot:TRINITY_DN80240_c0_g1_i1.p1 TRINITY_DN80240_c0_g1~~TRINITY_DN80240_c0_g1_i1.p1  ORF type:complete len:491 (-),score=88.50 TRINITY_DN80240_c0_g1_i1:40-1461(-)